MSEKTKKILTVVLGAVAALMIAATVFAVITIRNKNSGDTPEDSGDYSVTGLSIPADADYGIISGCVTGSENITVENVKVYATGNHAGMDYRTQEIDDAGYFALKVPEGRYEVSVEAPGYETQDWPEPVDVKNGEIAELSKKITLVRKAEAASQAGGALSYSDLPESFYFSSGVGGWGTTLFISADGSFEGVYSDRNFQTVYFNTYYGKFAPMQRINEYSYTLKIESLVSDNDLDKLGYFNEDAEYIPQDEPYGFDNAKEMILYVPGTPVSALSDVCMGLSHLSRDLTQIPSGVYLIYNKSEEYTFVGDKNDPAVNPDVSTTASSKSVDTSALPVSKKEIVELFKAANNVYYGSLSKDYNSKIDYDSDDAAYSEGGLPCNRVTGGKYTTFSQLESDLDRYFDKVIYSEDLNRYYAEKDGVLYVYEPLGEGMPPCKASKAELKVKSCTADTVEFEIVYTAREVYTDKPYDYIDKESYTIRKTDGVWKFSGSFNSIGELYYGEFEDFGSGAKWTY